MKANNGSSNVQTIKPILSNFVTILKIWNKVCSNTAIPPFDRVANHIASRKAHQTLQWMEYLASSGRNEDVKPNTSCYSIVIDAFAKSD